MFGVVGLVAWRQRCSSDRGGSVGDLDFYPVGRNCDDHSSSGRRLVQARFCQHHPGELLRHKAIMKINFELMFISAMRLFHGMKTTRFTLLFIFLSASICWTGCEMFASHTSPIADWKLDADHLPNQAIVKDYEDYFKKLPSGERNYAVLGQYFKDGTGQHAIVIEIALNGTDWAHVLIYDNNNKRVKTIKYVAGHYRS